jgi:uncharacterized protein
MRWQRQVVSATNLTRGAILGDRVRVADNILTGIVGLLGERELATGDGLLITPSQGVHTWGMLFSIDVLVLDRDWKVIAMRKAMRPFGMTRVLLNARSVLELPAGTADSTSTAVGDSLVFTPVEGAVGS